MKNFAQTRITGAAADPFDHVIGQTMVLAQWSEATSDSLPAFVDVAESGTLRETADQMNRTRDERLRGMSIDPDGRDLFVGNQRHASKARNAVRHRINCST
jgi:hypothetical protein